MYGKVTTYIQRNNMIYRGDIVIAGVSGGGDSMAMLHMLCRLKEKMLFQLRVVHVQHGIRGEEAERDCKLVQESCEKWNIPCSIYRYEVPFLAKEWKIGIEEAGRIVRKEAFHKEIEKGSYAEKHVKIALAHNKNDLAETMIHNLARGSGLRGMTGIQAVSDNIIRPLLCLERKEIDKYLLEEEIAYVTDSTNLDDQYTRNRIRHHILPILESEINEQAIAHMAEVADKINEADEYLRRKGHLLAEKFRVENKRYCLTKDFWDEEMILMKYAIIDIFENIAGKRKDLTQFHVEQVLQSYSLQTGKYICLPYNMLVKKGYQGVIIESSSFEVLCEKKEDTWMLPGKDGVYGSQKEFLVKIFPYTGQEICEKTYTKWFDYDKIKNDLSVRKRRTGDYIVIDKSGRKKKITRYMIDEKIPKDIRDSMTMLADDSEIVWVIGGRMNENYKVSRETKIILEITYQGGYGND